MLALDAFVGLKDPFVFVDSTYFHLMRLLSHLFLSTSIGICQCKSRLNVIVKKGKGY